MLSSGQMSDINSTPQFGTAEYAGDRCVACKQPITTRYYKVNGNVACESCTERVQRETPQESHAHFVRGLLFGVGGAIVGMILYAVITVTLHFSIGYFALGVGWLVGKAMMLGSKGFGGKRYQIAAAALTYAAISIAAVLILIAYQIKEDTAFHSATLARWLLIGLASPFLELQNPIYGILGLIILFVGISIAWRITQGSRAIKIQGPFDNSSTAPVMR